MQLRGFGVALVVGLVGSVGVFLACGSVKGAGGATTQSATGPQTATGPSSTVSATSAATTSSTNATTAAASSSSGSNNPKCDQACAHLDQCTGLTCAEVGLDCNTLAMQQDCTLDCVTGTACTSLKLGTFGTCDGMCAGDGGPAFPMGCQACLVFACGTPVQACAGDVNCVKWLTCTNACYQAMPTNPACFAACNSANLAAAALFQNIDGCRCGPCAMACATANPCSGGDGG